MELLLPTIPSNQIVDRDPDPQIDTKVIPILFR